MRKIIKEKDGYGTVQRDFMQMDISVYAKCVYTLLRTYSGQKDACYPSMKTICDDLRISKSTLIRAIKELEEIEMIAVRRTKKSGSKENSVNTYIPLSIMVEIDIEKVGLSDKEEGLGGTPQTPRGTPQTLGVVSEEYRKNNSIKNNIEESLNINTETSSVDEEFDLFGSSTKSKTTSSIKKEMTLYQKFIDVWLKEFKIGWKFTATDGKKMKSMIQNIQRSLKSHRQEFTDNDCVDLFRYFLSKLPDFYKNQNLSVLETKYDTIIEEIKSQKNGNGYSKYNKQSSLSKGRDVSSFFTELLQERS